MVFVIVIQITRHCKPTVQNTTEFRTSKQYVPTIKIVKSQKQLNTQLIPTPISPYAASIPDRGKSTREYPGNLRSHNTSQFSLFANELQIN